MACRKAYAAGLHNEAEWKPRILNDPHALEVRRVTFWALAFWERYGKYSLLG
jgi:hypothetical protein